MLNRRNFLKKIGAVCAGAVAIPVVVVAVEKKETSKRRQQSYYVARFDKYGTVLVQRQDASGERRSFYGEGSVDEVIKRFEVTFKSVTFFGKPRWIVLDIE